VALLRLGSVAACGDGVPAPAAMDPVSAEEAATLAAAFEAALEPCDAAKVGALLDEEQLVRRAVAASGVRKGDQLGMYQGMRRKDAAMGPLLCARFGAEVDVEVLRVVVRDGRPTPVLRILGSTGFNYYELELGKSRADHVVRIVDFYVYIAGERMSDTFARLGAQGVGAIRAGGDPEMLGRITAAQQRGDRAEARKLIGALPKPLRDSKQVRIMELATVIATDPDYQATIERFERAFPDDPALDIISLDGLYLRHDVPALVKTIDRLDRRVGGDPYLAFLRVNAYLLEPTPEHLAAAETAARAAVAGMPKNTSVLLALATVQLRRGDRTGAVVTLETLRALGSEVGRASVAKDPDWQAFFASPEYASWAAAK